MGIFTWPFRFAWALAGVLLRLTGRLLTAMIGLIVLVVGIGFTVTVVGALIGVPLVVLGGMLIFGAIF